MKDSHTASEIRKAVQRENAETVLKYIHDNMHVETKLDGEPYIVYHSPAAHEIIEAVSEALVEFDAGDLFREMCLRDGLEYDIQNLPAPGDINILDLAKQKSAKSLAEAIEAQGGKSGIRKALPALSTPAAPAKAAAKPTEVPKYLRDFHFALKQNFGGAAASTIFSQASEFELKERMTRLEAVTTAGLTHAIAKIDMELACSLTREAKKSGEVSQSVMQQMAANALRQSFQFEADTPEHKKLFAIALHLRDEAKTMGRAPDFAAAEITDEVLPENPVINGVELG